MVTVMVMNDLLPHPLCNVNRPSHSEIQLFQNLTMKIHGQGHVCGQRSMSHLTFKFQRSRLWSRSNPLVIFEAWSSIDTFRGNQTTFGWDIGNSIFDLENSRSRSWPRSNLIVTSEALEFNRYVCFSFRGNRTIFDWDIANSIFDLENSSSYEQVQKHKVTPCIPGWLNYVAIIWQRLSLEYS